ncbi:cytochrome c oxidase assembly factor Coa1 family protein [Mesorhizobium sp. 113-1-2]|uniref:cytochrome c oxidase assembly factor Coa1 family protein n=1 Tax=Mesorhizobium sp. 113-1-2 TaxID=2744515 RepID=UPI001FD00782|nr:cytochrome c oxidase assembly factor Coa1 family protein [Mesorhizobium sp. 113-1-2]
MGRLLPQLDLGNWQQHFHRAAGADPGRQPHHDLCAWRTRQPLGLAERAWRDAEQFRKTQRNWAIAGLVVWVVGIGGCAASVGSVPYILKGSDAYHMTMDAIRADTRVKAAIGDDMTDNFWVGGSLNVNANGAGDAQFGIPVHGAKGKGTVFSHLVRNAGTWSIRLLVVRVDGVDAPIVLTNEDHVPIPNAAIGI